MVSLGVKNPLLDLTALEDKTLDEVSNSKRIYERKQSFPSLQHFYSSKSSVSEDVVLVRI